MGACATATWMPCAIIVARRDRAGATPAETDGLVHAQHARRVGLALTQRGELDTAYPAGANHARRPARHALGEQARHEAPPPRAPEKRQEVRFHARVASKGGATAPGPRPQRRGAG